MSEQQSVQRGTETYITKNNKRKKENIPNQMFPSMILRVSNDETLESLCNKQIITDYKGNGTIYPRRGDLGAAIFPSRTRRG